MARPKRVTQPPPCLLVAVLLGLSRKALVADTCSQFKRNLNDGWQVCNATEQKLPVALPPPIETVRSKEGS
jgi:hypothetical protein